MKTKILILTITILALTSCRKYEEGGFYVLTNMSKKIAGKYNFTHYYIDGVDSVNYYFNNDYTAEFGLDFYKIDNKEIFFEYKYHNLSYDTLNFFIDGVWEWEDKKKTKLIIKLLNLDYFHNNIDTTIYNGPLSANISSVWDIRKLKKGELIIETSYNNQFYRAELKIAR